MTARPEGNAPVAQALARVLGLPPEARLRADTPVSGLGADSLSLILLADALAEEGWTLDARDARRAATIADLVGACRSSGRPT